MQREKPKIYTGVILKGKKRGTDLGFPTINIPLNDPLTSGIYIAQALIDSKKYKAAAYADQKQNLLESYLLDFNDILYGKTVTIFLIKKIRDSKIFENDQDLKLEIGKDVEAVREYFNSMLN